MSLDYRTTAEQQCEGQIACWWRLQQSKFVYDVLHIVSRGSESLAYLARAGTLS